MEPIFSANEFEGQSFKKLALAGQRFTRKHFDTCDFSKCAFTEAVFEACRFTGCTFTACDFSLARLEGCAFSGCRFEACRLIGIDWTDTAWARQKALLVKPADFHACTLNHSLFIGMALKHIALKDCTAHEVDFTGADLTAADCTGTDFNGSRFERTNLTEADFSGALNYAISPSLNTLKQTRFSLPEAMSLLYSLDIVLTGGDGEPEPPA